MKIATWNVERPRTGQNKKFAALQSCMQSIDADIWILTETHIDAGPGDNYIRISTVPIENERTHSPGETRVSIWSRLSLVAEVPTHDPETAVCAEIKSPFGPLLVYGTIIPYGGAGVKYPYRSAGIFQQYKRTWQLHSESIARHEADWKKIKTNHPGCHFCIGGDFNQNRDGTRWYGNKRVRSELGDSLSNCGINCLTEEDFRASGKLHSRANIDHLCASLELTRKVCEVDTWEAGTLPSGKRLSDHNGVWVSFSIQNSTEDKPA